MPARFALGRATSAAPSPRRVPRRLCGGECGWRSRYSDRVICLPSCVPSRPRTALNSLPREPFRSRRERALLRRLPPARVNAESSFTSHVVTTAFGTSLSRSRAPGAAGVHASRRYCCCRGSIRRGSRTPGGTRSSARSQQDDGGRTLEGTRPLTTTFCAAQSFQARREVLVCELSRAVIGPWGRPSTSRPDIPSMRAADASAGDRRDA